MKINIKTDYWERKENWQGKTNILIILTITLSLITIYYVEETIIRTIIIIINALTTIPMKISYNKWDREETRRRHQIK